MYNIKRKSMNTKGFAFVQWFADLSVMGADDLCKCSVLWAMMLVAL